MWKREINGEVKKNIPNKNKRRWSLFFLPFFLNWIKDSIKSAFQISLMLTSMGTMNGFRLWLFKTFKCLQPYSIIYIKNKLFCASMGIYTLCAHFSFTYICYYRFSFFFCVCTKNPIKLSFISRYFPWICVAAYEFFTLHTG